VRVRRISVKPWTLSLSIPISSYWPQEFNGTSKFGSIVNSATSYADTVTCLWCWCKSSISSVSLSRCADWSPTGERKWNKVNYRINYH
jgi:hypothetical protein